MVTFFWGHAKWTRKAGGYCGILFLVSYCKIEVTQSGRHVDPAIIYCEWAQLGPGINQTHAEATSTVHPVLCAVMNYLWSWYEIQVRFKDHILIVPKLIVTVGHKRCFLFFNSGPVFTRQNPFQPASRVGKAHYHPSCNQSLSKKKKKTVCFKVNFTDTAKHIWFSCLLSYNFLFFCRLWVLYVLTSDPVHNYTLWAQRANGCLRNVTAASPPLMENLFLQSLGPPLTVELLLPALQLPLTWRHPNSLREQENPQFPQS